MNSWNNWVYGCKWNRTNSSPDLTAGRVHRKNFVAQPFTRYPVQEGMLRCVMQNDGAIPYLLSLTDSTKKLNGDAANIDGTDGQVMVRIPSFHYVIQNDGTDYAYFLISRNPFSFYLPVEDRYIESAIHPFFMPVGVFNSYMYYSAFEGVLYHSGANVGGDGAGQWVSGDKIRSVAGYKPLTYESRSTFRTGCADGVFNQLSYWANEAITLLYLTEYKSWNSQSKIPGYTEDAAFVFADDVCKTGITKSLGNASGSILWQNADVGLRCTGDQTGLYVANSFRGIENFYGHIWKWVDGININYIGSPLTEAPIYVCNNPSQFADDTATNYTDSGLDMPLVGGYQKDIANGTLIPTTVDGGSSSTFLTDYFYASAGAGWRALLSGGGLTGGAYAGCAYRNTSNTASYRYAILGGRSVAKKG